MSTRAKDIYIKNRAYYFFTDIINIKNLDPNNIKRDEESYKLRNIEIIFEIHTHLQCKSFVPSFQQSEWIFEEIKGNKYLKLVPNLSVETHLWKL